jgi:hypothetical protein
MKVYKCLALLAIGLTSPAFSPKKAEVGHGYIAAKILEYQNQKDVIDIIEWYDFKRDSTDLSATAFRDGKGASISFISNYSDSVTTIEFTTPQAFKDIEKALMDCGYMHADKPRLDAPAYKGERFQKISKFSTTGKTCIIQSGSPTILYLIRN